MAPKASEMVISYRGLKDLVEPGLEAVETGVAAQAVSLEEAKINTAMSVGLQAALLQLRKADAEQRQKGDPSVFLALDHGPASLLQSFLAEEAAKGRGVQTRLESGGYEAKFDDEDVVGWAVSLRSWWRRMLDKHPFLQPPQEPFSLQGDMSVALLGDWGTALYGAPVCAHSITNGKISHNILMHLGDVYYAGTESEVENRFLAPWPRVQGAISRALNSNHEMYSGGNAYFRQTLPSAIFQQSASNFAIQNDSWMLLGLNSAYEGNDWAGGKLSADQIQWVRSMVERASKEGKRVVLFSHHQPFSLFDAQGPQLARCLDSLLNEKRVFAWYWGHEHRCVIYKQHPTWKLYGRCVGHSGYPYFRDLFDTSAPSTENKDGSRWVSMSSRYSAPEAWVLDGPNPYVKGHEDRYGPNGYMTLKFSREHLTEIVNSADGTVILEQILS